MRRTAYSGIVATYSQNRPILCTTALYLGRVYNFNRGFRSPGQYMGFDLISTEKSQIHSLNNTPVEDAQYISNGFEFGFPLHENGPRTGYECGMWGLFQRKAGFHSMATILENNGYFYKYHFS